MRQEAPSPAAPEPLVRYRLYRAEMLLFRGFAPKPTYYAPKIFVDKEEFGA